MVVTRRSAAAKVPALMQLDVLSQTFDSLGVGCWPAMTATVRVVCKAWLHAATLKNAERRVLQLFRSVGQLQQWPFKGEALDAFHSLDSAVVLPDGDVCIADRYNHRVVRLSGDGTPRRCLGSNSDGPVTPRQVDRWQWHSNPVALACDGDYVYICDNLNEICIRRQKLAGRNQMETPSSTDARSHRYHEGQASVKRPSGAVFVGGMLFVSDSKQHAVFGFDMRVILAHEAAGQRYDEPWA